MKRKPTQLLLSICLLICLSYFNLHAQVYPDHFGTGNNVGVTITSSSEQGDNTAEHTLNGTGFFTDLEGSSRFLAQSALGANYEDINYVSQIGINAWLDEQFTMPYTPYLTKYQSIYTEAGTMINAVHPNEPIDRARDYTGFAFYEKVLKENDVLRNKAAFALSQIFVVSTANIDLNNKGFGGASYYDVLYEGAFSNFRNLLTNVSLHLTMGYYLSHFRNQKADPATGTLPDENYAREVMQLFTIGLYELNNDGTYRLDANNNKIPTYDITDVQELAKVFTGLSGGAWDLEFNPSNAGQPLIFNRPLNFFDMTVPMMMHEDRHEPGTKIMIDGSIIPAGQPGMQDISDALDILFNHPNVGPFISTRLIQQLVKSNPSAAYINRVASAFNNNGAGIRGDMEAVFRAILTDPEARDCEWLNDSRAGKLRQPLERMLGLFHAFDIDSPSGKLWFRDVNVLFDRIEQAYMAAPSVFNFFSPFYAEETYVAPNDMVSPEFEILHSVTAIHYMNLIEETIAVRPFRNRTGVDPNMPRLAADNSDDPFLDFSDEIAEYDTNGLAALIDRLDLIMCHGQLSAGSRAIILNAMTQIENAPGNFSSEDIVHVALYFMLISADYTILK